MVEVVEDALAPIVGGIREGIQCFNTGWAYAGCGEPKIAAITTVNMSPRADLRNGLGLLITTSL